MDAMWPHKKIIVSWLRICMHRKKMYVLMRKCCMTVKIYMHRLKLKNNSNSSNINCLYFPSEENEIVSYRGELNYI